MTAAWRQRPMSNDELLQFILQHGATISPIFSLPGVTNQIFSHRLAALCRSRNRSRFLWEHLPDQLQENARWKQQSKVCCLMSEAACFLHKELRERQTPEPRADDVPAAQKSTEAPVLCSTMQSDDPVCFGIGGRLF